jgi:hypothetical protein
MKKNNERNLRNRLAYIVSCILVFVLTVSNIPAILVKADSYDNQSVTQFTQKDVEGYDATKTGFDYEVTKAPTSSEPGEVTITGVDLPYQPIISVPDYVKAYGNTYEVTAIGEDAFRKVETDEINLSDTVRLIDDDAFEQTTAKKIRLSSNIESISGNPFDFCLSLENIELDNNNQYYYSDGDFLYTKNGKTLITTVNFQESVTIKEGVENVLPFALSNCGFFVENEICKMLQKVTFPSTVKTIGKGNMNFYLFVFNSKNPPEFDGTVDPTSYALVPKGCLKKYQSLEYQDIKVFSIFRVKDTKKYYLKNKKFVENLDYRKYLKANNNDIIKEAKNIVENAKDDKEKAMCIYKYIVENYCLDNSRYSDSVRKNKDKLSTVFKNKIGSYNGINNVTVELFRANGIPAVNVSLMERDGTYNYNFDIVLVYIDEKWNIVYPSASTLNVYENGKKSTSQYFYKYSNFYLDMDLQSLLADFNYVVY